jgi:glutamate 5-kinase
MLHAMNSTGKIIVDIGASKALINKGASLLPSGISSVEGNFSQGEAVQILVKEGKMFREIAKGITRYNSSDLSKIKGKKSSEIEAILGFINAPEVIHRDELVLMDEN